MAAKIGDCVAVAFSTATGVKVKNGRLLKVVNPLFGPPIITIRQGVKASVTGVITFKKVVITNVIGLARIPTGK